MRFRYWILAMMVSLFAACSSDEEVRAGGDEEELSDLVTEVSASYGGFTVGITRGEGDDEDHGTTKRIVKDAEPEDEDYILGMKEFKEGDKIYILQRGPNLTPKFPGDFFDNRKKEDYKVDNIYVYEYKKNDDANWSNEYNFEYNPKRCDPISWSKVKENGSIGNSFVFYAFCDNLKDLEPRKEYGDLLYESSGVDYYHHAYGGVWKLSDRNQDALKNYDYSNDWHAYHYQNHCGVPDFLGAYHTTSALYSRPRFKFYHLLAYVRVTLYVPVVVDESYQEKDPSTGQEVWRPTGYDEKAFALSYDGENMNYSAGVWIGDRASSHRQMRTRFTIDWGANRSSDKDAPLTQVLKNASSPGFIFAYCMYRHNPLDITDARYKPTVEKDIEAVENGIPIIEDFDVTKFVENNATARKYLTPTKKEEDGKTVTKYYDKVRRYEFSAAMPAQELKTSGTIDGTSNPATDILMQIHVRTSGHAADAIKNGGATSSTKPHNNYAEYTLRTTNLLAGANNLELKQNTITHLYVYLPRVADEAILVQAKVLPWEETHTEMTVTPDDW